jgi:hypothetical protein
MRQVRLSNALLDAPIRPSSDHWEKLVQVVINMLRLSPLGRSRNAMGAVTRKERT